MGAVRENAAAKGRPHLSFTFALAILAPLAHTMRNMQRAKVLYKRMLTIFQRGVEWLCGKPTIPLLKSSPLPHCWRPIAEQLNYSAT
jgi:hypothetical protein